MVVRAATPSGGVGGSVLLAQAEHSEVDPDGAGLDELGAGIPIGAGACGLGSGGSYRG